MISYEECSPYVFHVSDGDIQKVELVDTAGMHQFPAMRQLRISAGHAFIVVYAIDNAMSFEEALRLVDTVIAMKGKHKKLVVFSDFF